MCVCVCESSTISGICTRWICFEKRLTFSCSCKLNDLIKELYRCWFCIFDDSSLTVIAFDLHIGSVRTFKISLVQLIWKKKQIKYLLIVDISLDSQQTESLLQTRNKTMHKLSKQFNIYLTHNWLSLCYLLGRTLIFDSILSFNLLDWHNFQQIIHILFSSWISNRTIDSHHRAMWKYTCVLRDQLLVFIFASHKWVTICVKQVMRWDSKRIFEFLSRMESNENERK